jgi:hypothetical protein
MATVIGDLVVVASARPRSQWVRNLAAQPRVHYWMGGRRHEATAVVLERGTASDPAAAPSLGGVLATLLLPWTHLGVSVALLVPQRLAAADARTAG